MRFFMESSGGGGGDIFWPFVPVEMPTDEWKNGVTAMCLSWVMKVQGFPSVSPRVLE